MVLGRRVDYLSPTLYLTDILIGLIIITWFLSSRGRSDGDAISYQCEIASSKTPRNDKIRKVRFAIIVTLLFIAINVFFAVNKPVAIYKWLKAVEFVLLGYYIVKTKVQLSAISYPLSVGILYSSLIAIGQFYFQHSIGGPLWWLGERTFALDTPGIARVDTQFSIFRLRPYATFPHPNVLGGFLAVVLPLVIASARQRVSASAQWLFRVSFVFGIVALVLTFSRSAIVIGILALAFVFFQKKKIFFFFSILILTFSVFRLPFTFFEESVTVRQQLNVAAIRLWQTSPLFGVGLGNFLVRLPEALPTRTIYFLQPVHNIYLLLLSEVGVVGFLFFIWFLQKIFRHPFGIWHLAFGILLVLGLVDHYPLTLQQGQLLLTLLMSLAIVDRTRNLTLY